MDTKRLVLFMAISIAFIMIYQYFFMPKPAPRPAQPAAQHDIATPGKTQTPAQTPAQTEDQGLRNMFTKKKKEAPAEETTAEPVQENLEDTQSKNITVETDMFTAVFTNEGAGLKSFILKKYKDDAGEPLDLVSQRVEGFKTGKYPLYPFHFAPFEGDELLLTINDKAFLYEGDDSINANGSDPVEIMFQYKNAETNVSAWKKFILRNGTYIIEMQYELTKDGQPLDVPFVFGPDLENNIKPERSPKTNFKLFAWDGQDETETVFHTVETTPVQGRKNYAMARSISGNNFKWAAYQRDYFAAIFRTFPGHSSVGYTVVKQTIIPEPGKEKTGEKKDEEEKEDDEEKDDYKLFSYMIVTNPSMVYLGPKDPDQFELIQAQFPDADESIDYGFLAAIAKILLQGIKICYSFVPNYGWAIILFTLVLKIVLFPLTYTSSVSMAKMQALQPKIKALKKKFKNMKDPEQRRKFSEEQMALFKREKVNPASGCLPMLLQMPILFAFFYLLRISIIVRHEPWLLWITDLSLKDPWYILPVLNGLSMIVLNKLSPTSASPDGGAQQKIMMWMMPIFITFIGFGFPSGLLVYWVFSNILQMGQQLIINKKIFKEKKEEEKERKALKRKKGVKTK